MSDIKPELVDRMVALVREIVDGHGAFFSAPYTATAKAIVAELPLPVDPELATMREGALECGWCESRLEQLEVGLLDLWKRAVQRGRELETDDRIRAIRIQREQSDAFRNGRHGSGQIAQSTPATSA